MIFYNINFRIIRGLNTLRDINAFIKKLDKHTTIAHDFVVD